MKRFLLFFLACLMLTGCAAEVEIGTTATYEDYQAELLEAEFFTDDEGRQLVKVNLCYTNGGSEGLYLLESFVIKAYQDDVQLTDCTDINEETALIQEVKDGVSISGSYTFEVTSDASVKVRIYTPTADEVLLAEKEYVYDS